MSSLQLPTLPPPSHYLDNSSYDELWKKCAAEVSNTRNQTVLDAAWNERYLVACTASGDIVIWQIPMPHEESDAPAGDEDTADCDLEAKRKRRKNMVVRISTGALYCIQFRANDNQTLLLVSGDEGVWSYDWADWILFLKAQSPHVSPAILAHFQPHPSTTSLESSTPVYDFDVQSPYLFAAAGDGFGCYKWNMETQQLVATYSTKHQHQAYSVRATTDVDGTPLAIVAGQDGSVSLWDATHDSLIEHMDIRLIFRENETLVATDASLRQKPSVNWKSSATRLWVSDISTTNSDWWTICGGVQSGQSTFGFLATWHASTRSLVAASLTRESPHCIMAAPSDKNGTVIVVADEGVVSYWNPTQLQRTGRVWCSPPSSYAIAIRPEDDCAVIGGVGAQLDVFQNLTDRACTLSLQNPRDHKK